MTLDAHPDLATSHDMPSTATVAELVGQVYETAALAERGHMLAQLLRPLGVLSLFGIAHGIFANMRFKGGWPEFHARPEDLLSVCSSDVIALVNHVQQVSVESVDGLAQLLSASPPLLAGSATVALLIATLLQRAKARAAAGGRAAGDVPSSAP